MWMRLFRRGVQTGLLIVEADGALQLHVGRARVGGVYSVVDALHSKYITLMDPSPEASRVFVVGELSSKLTS